MADVAHAPDVPIQLSTFRLGEEWFGVDVLAVQEVMNPLRITKVPLSPQYVQGLINVRGVLVTVVSLKERLIFDSKDYQDDHKLVIVNADDGLVCFQVDEIGDVIETEVLAPADVPSTLRGSIKEYVSGVFKQQGRLITHLDVQKVVDA